MTTHEKPSPRRTVPRIVVVAVLGVVVLIFSVGVAAVALGLVPLTNYELLSKERDGDAVWKVTFGHALHDGFFDYEDTDRDGHVDRVRTAFDSDYRMYVVVGNDTERTALMVEVLRRMIVPYPGDLANWDLLPGLPILAEEQYGETLLFLRQPDEPELVTFVIKGSPVAEKLQKEFEQAKEQPEDEELTVSI